jgi:hypothetical protein
MKPRRLVNVLAVAAALIGVAMAVRSRLDTTAAIMLLAIPVGVLGSQVLLTVMTVALFGSEHTADSAFRLLRCEVPRAFGAGLLRASGPRWRRAFAAASYE